MKICWFGIYDKDYPRNFIFLEGLRNKGIEVVHCQVDPKEPSKYSKLTQKFRRLLKTESIDVVYVGFPAQPATIVAKLLTRKHVVMDAMSSSYESAVYNRREIGRWHPKAIKLLLFDWLSALCADQIIVDTAHHKQYWASWWLIDHKKIDVVYIGTSTKNFYPTNNIQRTSGKDALLVQYHGSYGRIQGFDVMLGAIERLRNESNISFRFIGSGHEYPKVRQALSECCAEKVAFVEQVPFTELNQYLNEPDIIFGLFGEADRADNAIPNKLYEGLAVGKLVINKDTPAVREVFTDKDVVLIKRDPDSLAAAIKKFQNKEVREKIARHGHRSFLEHFSESKVTERLLQVIDQSSAVGWKKVKEASIDKT